MVESLGHLPEESVGASEDASEGEVDISQEDPDAEGDAEEDIHEGDEGDDVDSAVAEAIALSMSQAIIASAARQAEGEGAISEVLEGKDSEAVPDSARSLASDPTGVLAPETPPPTLRRDSLATPESTGVEFRAETAKTQESTPEAAQDEFEFECGGLLELLLEESFVATKQVFIFVLATSQDVCMPGYRGAA
jgi:hypothetical protein